jgi:hypothetical protein
MYGYLLFQNERPTYVAGDGDALSICNIASEFSSLISDDVYLRFKVL